MAFPLATFPKQRAIRQEFNPLDKSTIFSIFPKPLDDIKCTLVPASYHVDAGSVEKPSRLVVGTASWFREIDDTQPMLEIPTSSIKVAQSIVADYCNGIFGCDMDKSMPGWFFCVGDIPVSKLKSNEIAPETVRLDERGNTLFIGFEYIEIFNLAVERQREFFNKQIRLADALWAKTNGSPLAITDDMRLAASELGVEREWTVRTSNVTTIRCIACGNMRNPQFPVCSSCNRVIDTELYKKLNIAEAK